MTENAFLQEKKDRQFRRTPSVSASISPRKGSTTTQVRTWYRNSETGVWLFGVPTPAFMGRAHKNQFGVCHWALSSAAPPSVHWCDCVKCSCSRLLSLGPHVSPWAMACHNH